MVPSKMAMTEADRKAVPRLTSSQGTREREVAKTVSDSSSSPTPPMRSRSSSASCWMTSTTSSMVSTPTSRSFSSTTAADSRSYCSNSRAASSWSIVAGIACRVSCMMSSILTERLVRRIWSRSTRAEQLEGRIDDEDLAETVGQVLVLAHVVDGLADRPERRHRHELGLHAPAGGLFRIVERAPQPDALGERQLRQDLVLVLLVEVFQDVDGVVGIELLDGLGDLLVGQVVDDVEADRLVDLGQRGEVEILAEQFDQRAALLGHQRFEQVAELRLVQAPDVLLQRQRIAIGDRSADMRQERRSG